MNRARLPFMWWLSFVQWVSRLDDLLDLTRPSGVPDQSSCCNGNFRHQKELIGKHLILLDGKFFDQSEKAVIEPIRRSEIHVFHRKLGLVAL